MDENILVSIIVPVFNVQDYLCECIDSVLNQNFSNYELIIVDDGSSDSCPEICDQYSKKDNRIKVIHKENGGLSDARNSGILKAKGKYILFLDGDDKFLQNDLFFDFLNKSETEIVFFNSIHESEHKRHWIEKNKIINVKRTKFIKKTFFSVPYQTAWMFCVKRDFLIKNNLFFEKGLIHEDEEWLPRVILSLTDSWIPVCEKSVYWYRLNRNGSIVNSKNDMKIKCRYYICKKMMERYSVETTVLSKKFLATRISQIYNSIRKAELFKSFDKSDRIRLRSFLLKSMFLKHKLLYFFLMINNVD